MTTRSIYQALLREKSPEAQYRVFEYASRVSDTGLLVDLCGIDNLVAELDTKLSERPEADVLVAWATRPGRTTEAMMQRFKNEKRATILSELALRSDLPKELYVQLANTGKPTVAEVVLHNTAAPDEARAIAARLIGSRAKSTWSLASKLLPSSAGDEVWLAMVSEASVYDVLVAAVNAGRGHDLEMAIVSRLLELMARENPTDEGWSARHHLQSVVRGITDLDARAALKAGCERLVALAAAGTPLGQDALKVATEVAVAPTVTPIDRAFATIRDDASPDGDVVASVNLIITQASYQERQSLTTAVLGRTHVPAEALEAICGYFGRRGFEWVGRVVEVAQGNLPLLAKIAVINGAVDEVTEAVVASGVAEEDFLDVMFDDGERIKWVLDSKVAHRHRELVLQKIPVHIALESRVTSTLASQHILQRLGTDVVRWEMLENLVGEWSGSLTQLLDAVDTL